MKIQFQADRVHVSGPSKTDNSYTIKFETGEYTQEVIAALTLLPIDGMKIVTVEMDNG